MRSLLLLALVAGAASCVTPATSVAPSAARQHDVAGAHAISRDELLAYQAMIGAELGEQTPALAGPVSTVPAFQFVCGAAALRISPPTGSADYLGMVVWNGTNAGGPNANVVFLGDTTGMTNTTGMPICATSSCVSVAMEYESRNVFCLAPAGNTTVTVEVVKP